MRILGCPSCGEAWNLIDMAGIGRCYRCDHRAFVKPIGTQKYDEEYYKRYVGYESSELGHKISDWRWLQVQSLLPCGGRVLDYGCGAGAFVHSAPEGYVATGYDINPSSPFCDESVLGLKYDCVTMFDVLEHAEYPLDLLRRFDSQFLVILTPDVTCPNARRDFQNWRHYRSDEHQHYFSPLSLTQTAYRAGYRLLWADRMEARLRNREAGSDLMTMAFEREEQ